MELEIGTTTTGEENANILESCGPAIVNNGPSFKVVHNNASQSPENDESSEIDQNFLDDHFAKTEPEDNAKSEDPIKDDYLGFMSDVSKVEGPRKMKGKSNKPLKMIDDDDNNQLHYSYLKKDNDFRKKRYYER